MASKTTPKKAKTDNKNYIIIGLLAVLFIVGLAIGIFVGTNLPYGNKNEELTQTKAKLAEKEKQEAVIELSNEDGTIYEGNFKSYNPETKELTITQSLEYFKEDGTSEFKNSDLTLYASDHTKAYYTDKTELEPDRSIDSISGGTPMQVSIIGSDKAREFGGLNESDTKYDMFAKEIFINRVD